MENEGIQKFLRPSGGSASCSDEHDALKTAKSQRRSGYAEITVGGYQMVDKTVMKCGTSGRIYLPPDWIGKRVKVILIDDPEAAPSTE